MGMGRHFHQGLAVSLLATAWVAATCLSGCSETTSAVVPASGATAEWPSASLGDIIIEPAFGTKPSAVYDCDNYVIVSYEDLSDEELFAYVDALEANPDFDVMYDKRNPVLSCCVSDWRGNSVTISQVDGMVGADHKMTSISVVKA